MQLSASINKEQQIKFGHASCKLFSLFSLVHAQCKGGIPGAEAAGFLTAHNKLRQSISSGNFVAKGRRMPAARVPIPNLTWDCGLERSAQSVTNGCVFEHSEYSKTLGENLYMQGGTQSFAGKGKAASDAWEAEFQKFGWPSILFTRAIFDSGIGHATQMAWAKSTRIGCGMTACSGGRVIVACHYRDAGNFFTQNVYEPVGGVPPPTTNEDEEEEEETTEEEEEEETTTEEEEEEDDGDEETIGISLAKALFKWLKLHS